MQDQSRLQGVVNLLSLLSGNNGKTKTVESGGTTTQQTKLSSNDVTAIIKNILGSTNGLAAVSSGQHAAGLYNSTVQTQLVNDLLSRVSTDVAAKAAPTVTTKSPTRTVKGPAGGNNTGAILAGLGFLNKNRKDLMGLFSSPEVSSPEFSYNPTAESFSVPELSSVQSFDPVAAFAPDAGSFNLIESLVGETTPFNLADLGAVTESVPDLSFMEDTVGSVMDASFFKNGGVVRRGKKNFANGGVVTSASTADIHRTPDQVEEEDIFDPVKEYLDKTYTFFDRYEMERTRPSRGVFDRRAQSREEYENPSHIDPDTSQTVKDSPRYSREYGLGDDKFLVPSGRSTGLRVRAPGEEVPTLGNKVSVWEDPFDEHGRINLKGWTIDDREKQGGFFSDVLGGLLPVLSIIAPAFGGVAGLLGGFGSGFANSAVNFAAKEGLQQLAKPDIPDQVNLSDVIDVQAIQDLAQAHNEEIKKRYRSRFASGGFTGLLPGNDTTGKDNLTVQVGGGEVVIPNDVVNQLGEDFFLNLINSYHRA